VTGLLGGAFDPPHLGHVALARAAEERFALERLVVLVSERPGHKQVETPANVRLRLARAAFPGREVELDPHERTVDTLRAGSWPQPIFLIGADELADFMDWKEPQAVLELARLGVATRPGYARERLERVLAQLPRKDRVELFEIDRVPAASREIRARVEAAEPIDGLVPEAVADLIRELGLYRHQGGVH
jgi:nicotinate-nucleotide adenylyltransferase